ncbi:protein of unknown function [Hymenobacter mucosus]|uniref:DUF4296 domain-containing protein n=1 Tax=Hymenobacter mucosus TaxID=1411120 RepID=A0A238XTS0_9BACT|nr:protein of unknown function [Hymenobacter mucosus]
MLTLLATACEKPDEAVPPAQLVPKDKMAGLLVELHTLEARIDATGLPMDSARAMYVQQQKSLLWRYQVTDSSFQQSYRYYAVHGKDLDEIYGVVIDTLGLREVRQGGTQPGPSHP